jgi:hypothetical protein
MFDQNVNVLAHIPAPLQQPTLVKYLDEASGDFFFVTFQHSRPIAISRLVHAVD